MKQWEIWKFRALGFPQDHWFVVISPDERLASQRLHQVNGLACFTLHGDPSPAEVRLNSADGFDHATVCQCDLLFILDKAQARSRIGQVSFERQQAIKRKVISVLRFVPA